MDDLNMTILLFLSLGGSLLFSEGNLVKDELWDGMREGWGYGQEGGLGLETELVGDEFDINKFTFSIQHFVCAEHVGSAILALLTRHLEADTIIHFNVHAVGSVFIHVDNVAAEEHWEGTSVSKSHSSKAQENNSSGLHV